MKTCTKCLGTRLNLIFYDNFDYRAQLYQGQWELVDPGSLGYYYSTQYPPKVQCQSCHYTQNLLELPESLVTADLSRYPEITFDLDGTLFHTEYYSVGEKYVPSCDFTLVDTEAKINYYITKRPYVSELIKYCEDRFQKINFFTAALDWYAEKLISSLAISPGKIGWVKTRADTYRGRPLSFEWEFLKPQNQALIVEDKPLVVQGEGNQIIKVLEFGGDLQDQELLRVIQVLKSPAQKFCRPEIWSGQVELFLYGLNLPFTNITTEQRDQLLQLPVITEAEMAKLPVRTTLREVMWKVQDGVTVISWAAVNYQTYCQIIKIIGAPGKPISKIKFNKLLTDKYRRFSDF